MDLPVGPDYVLGPGDSLEIDLWGGVSQRVFRVVDREGRVSLPEAGPLLLSGRSLGDVQLAVQQVLRTEYLGRYFPFAPENRSCVRGWGRSSPRRLRYQFALDSAECVVCRGRGDAAWFVAHLNTIVANSSWKRWTPTTCSYMESRPVCNDWRMATLCSSPPWDHR